MNVPNKSQPTCALQNHSSLTLNMHLVGLPTMTVQALFRNQQPSKTHAFTPKNHPATTQTSRATSTTNQHNHNNPFHLVHMDPDP